MSLIAAVGLFVLGLAIVLFSAEQMVKGVVGTSLALGVSAFLITVVFIGFDPDNLSVGAVASFEQAPGIAWGAIIGSAMVAVAFAFGISALLAPMRFTKAPRRILIVPLLAILFFGALAIDGQLSRWDGAALLTGYAGSVLWIFRLSRRGLDIRPTGEVAESLEKKRRLGRWQPMALLLLSLIGIIVGSEMVLAASIPILDRLGISQTVFGMTVLAFVVSIEELARELPAALKGRPEITFGNVLGSVLAMFLFNGGIIALVRPLPVSPEVLRFYLPYSFATVLVVSGFVASRRVGRWAGALLVLLYVGFVIGSYLVGGNAPPRSGRAPEAVPTLNYALEYEARGQERRR